MVERVTEQQVTSNAIPNASLRLNASGAVGGQIGESLINAGTAGTNIAIKQAQERAQQAAMEGDNKLSEFVIPYLSDTETGAYTKKRKDARGIAATGLVDFDKTVRIIEKDLSPASQKAFRRLATTRRNTFLNALSKHELAEFEGEKEDNTNQMISSSVQMISNHPADMDVLEAESNRIRAAINSTFRGSSEKVRNQKYEAAMSIAHGNSVQMLLNGNKTEKAQAYFDAYKEVIDPKTKLTLMAQMKDVTDLEAAQAAADEIIGIHSDDYTKAIKRAKSKLKGDKRAKAVALIDKHFKRIEVIENRDRHEKLKEAWNIVEQGGSTDDFSSELRSAIDPRSLASMESRERDKIAGREPVHQPEKWIEFNRLIMQAWLGDVEAQDKLVAMDVNTEYGQSFDRRHLDLAVSAQVAYVQQDVRAERSSLANSIKMVRDGTALTNLISDVVGKKPTKKGVLLDNYNFRARSIENWVQGEVDAWHQMNPKAKTIPSKDRDEILDRARIEMTVTDAGPLWFDKEMGIKDIPSKEYKKIVNQIEAKGLKVTPSLILTTYEIQQR